MPPNLIKFYRHASFVHFCRIPARYYRSRPHPYRRDAVRADFGYPGGAAGDGLAGSGADDGAEFCGRFGICRSQPVAEPAARFADYRHYFSHQQPAYSDGRGIYPVYPAFAVEEAVAGIVFYDR